MKKISIPLSILLAITFTMPAKAQVVGQILNDVLQKHPSTKTGLVKKGAQFATIGYGFPNNMATYLNLGGFGSFLSTSTSKSGFGPVFVGYEYMFSDYSGLGANIAYANATQVYKGLIGIGDITGKISGFSILASYTRHIESNKPKFDPYMRGAFGLNIWKGSYKDASNNDYQSFTAPTPVAYQALIGARYFFNEHTAVFGEVSYSTLKFTANAGISFKLK